MHINVYAVYDSGCALSETETWQVVVVKPIC